MVQTKEDVSAPMRCRPFSYGLISLVCEAS